MGVEGGIEAITRTQPLRRKPLCSREGPCPAAVRPTHRPHLLLDAERHRRGHARHAPEPAGSHHAVGQLLLQLLLTRVVRHAWRLRA